MFNLFSGIANEFGDPMIFPDLAALKNDYPHFWTPKGRVDEEVVKQDVELGREALHKVLYQLYEINLYRPESTSSRPGKGRTSWAIATPEGVGKPINQHTELTISNRFFWIINLAIRQDEKLENELAAFNDFLVTILGDAVPHISIQELVEINQFDIDRILLGKYAELAVVYSFAGFAYQKRGLAMDNPALGEDLVQEAFIGICKAARNLRIGVSGISNYMEQGAMGGVLNYIRSTSTDIKVPGYVVDLINKVSSVTARYGIDLDAFDTEHFSMIGMEIDYSQLSRHKRKLRMLLRRALSARGMTSIDEPTHARSGEGGPDSTGDIYSDGGDLLDLISDEEDQYEQADSRLTVEWFKGEILKSIEEDRSRKVFWEVEMLEDTLDAVAARYGVTRERIRQINSTTRRRIQRILHGLGMSDSFESEMVHPRRDPNFENSEEARQRDLEILAEVEKLIVEADTNDDRLNTEQVALAAYDPETLIALIKMGKFKVLRGYLLRARALQGSRFRLETANYFVKFLHMTPYKGKATNVLRFRRGSKIKEIKFPRFQWGVLIIILQELELLDERFIHQLGAQERNFKQFFYSLNDQALSELKTALQAILANSEDGVLSNSPVINATLEYAKQNYLAGKQSEIEDFITLLLDYLDYVIADMNATYPEYTEFSRLIPVFNLNSKQISIYEAIKIAFKNRFTDSLHRTIEVNPDEISEEVTVDQVQYWLQEENRGELVRTLGSYHIYIVGPAKYSWPSLSQISEEIYEQLLRSRGMSES